MGWLLGILVLTVVAGGARLYPTSHEPITTGASPIGQSMPASTDAAHPAASVVHAVIKGSLYQTVSDAGFGLPLAIQLRDIFSDKVDFRRDLRAGDWFTAIYAPGRPSSMTAGTRTIIAAELSIRGHIYRAFRFPESEVVDEYFTEAGQSLHRSILRAPLNYSHIASIFSYHRLDPVLGIIRPHFGVDYAAPMGTPIGAAADGYIRFLGVDGGYGNLIVITSFGRYETYYAHLLRFAPGLHAGSRVQQGHVIGYVGESGEATGPHLHYGIKVNGRWSDPLTVPLPDAKPLPKAERAEFQQQVATLLAQLQSAGMVQGPPRSTAMRVADSRTKKPESAARPDGIAH
jgi:murein DD-endopeptidase MepM/ murein hydrolase activator NlpD